MLSACGIKRPLELPKQEKQEDGKLLQDTEQK